MSNRSIIKRRLLKIVPTETLNTLSTERLLALRKRLTPYLARVKYAVETGDYLPSAIRADELIAYDHALRGVMAQRPHVERV